MISNIQSGLVIIIIIIIRLSIPNKTSVWPLTFWATCLSKDRAICLHACQTAPFLP